MLQPLRSGVLLKPQTSTKESVAGLIITGQVENEGIVMAVGPEVKELKPGHVVRYDAKSAAKVDGLLLCREADVLCIVEAE